MDTAQDCHIQRLNRITNNLNQRQLQNVEEVSINVGLLYKEYDSAYVRHVIDGEVQVLRVYYYEQDSSVVYEDVVSSRVFYDSKRAESLMRQHDWYYERSDDHRVWKRGREAEAKVRAALSKLPENERKRLWEKHAQKPSS